MGLSVSEAARLGPVNRETWTKIEQATRSPEGYTAGRVERVLGWQPGSVEAILNGGKPTDTDAPPPKPADVDALDQWEADLIRDIRDDPRLDDEAKLELVARTRRIAVQQRAALRDAELERETLRARLRLLQSRNVG